MYALNWEFKVTDVAFWLKSEDTFIVRNFVNNLEEN